MTGLFPPGSLVLIYFFYGLAFFSLGLAVLLEAQRSVTELPFAQAMLPLATFGLLHGGHEWLEMFVKEAGLHGYAMPYWVDGVRVLLLAISFCALIAFGIRLLYPMRRKHMLDMEIGIGMLVFWLIGVLAMALITQPGNAMHLTVRSWLDMADTWSRYSLAVPGSLFSSYALWQQARVLRRARRRFAYNLYVAAVAFLFYGLVGQVFVTETYLFPSNLLNAALFEQVIGVPVQLFRALTAIALALTLIPALNMFELERRQALAAAERIAREELARRETLQRQMLRHTVAAQEDERRRIARELHDEIGQTLTALSLGLERLLLITQREPEHLPEAIDDLRQLSNGAVSELHHLVTELRPSQLDHLGLAAAMRSLAADYRRRFGLKVQLHFEGERRRLPGEIELAIFRIAQEALTNVVRHAEVDSADVRLEFAPEAVSLCICDRGIGFSPPEIRYSECEHWGLMGMTERATQLNGTLTIEAAPGQGTRVTARLPLQEQIEVDHGGKDTDFTGGRS